MKNYYFTFGSDRGFPYQNTYIIVRENSMPEAIEKFRKRFPDRHKDTINCAFWYTEDKWRGTLNEKYYGEPALIL